MMWIIILSWFALWIYIHINVISLDRYLSRPKHRRDGEITSEEAIFWLGLLVTVVASMIPYVRWIALTIHIVAFLCIYFRRQIANGWNWFINLGKKG